MNFLYPQFLFALFTVLIPVIIHLFNFQKYKKVSFSNVSFLKEIKHSTKAKSNLKHILILISRILAISALVLAFAQPFIPLQATQNTSAKSSTIFLDNSFSMATRSEDGRVFEIAREFAYKLAEELPNSKKHQLLTNDFAGVEQRTISTSEMRKNIPLVKMSSQSQNLDRIIKRQNSAMNGEEYSGFIISDFQKSQFNWNELEIDSAQSYYLLPLEPLSVQNVAIDSVWFTQPVHRIKYPEEVHFRVHNYGSQEKTNVRATLEINGKQVSFTTLSLSPYAYVDTFLVFNSMQAGHFSGKIEIEDLPIEFDNTFHFNYSISPEIQILSINTSQSPNFVSKAYALEPYFLVKDFNETNVDFGEFDHAQLVVMNHVTNFSTGFISTLSNYLQKGGNIILFPSGEEDQSSLNSFLQSINVASIVGLTKDSTRVQFIDFENDIYKGVFTETNSKINLPLLYQNFELSAISSTGRTDLLKTVSGQSILSKWTVGEGSLYLFATPLQDNFTNLPKHSIFLPTIYQIAFQSARKQKNFQFIGVDEFVKINAIHNQNEDLFHIVNRELDLDIIPEITPELNEIRLGFHQSIQTAGNYELLLNDSLLGYLSFNYTRIESNPEFYSADELQDVIDSLGLSNFRVFEESLEDFSSEYKKLQTGIELWKWFVILALLFLALEVILIRYFKPSVL